MKKQELKKIWIAKDIDKETWVFDTKPVKCDDGNWRADSEFARTSRINADFVDGIDCTNKPIEFVMAEERQSKTGMKPFNLEKAKAGKPVCTRNGRSVEILRFDVKDPIFPIVAIIKYKNGSEGIQTYTNEGYLSAAKEENDYDLMMESEKKQGWVNLYRESHGGLYTLYYPSKEAALIAKSNNEKYIDTIPLEWEE